MFLPTTVAIVLALLVVLTASTVRWIPQGQVYSLYRFGRPARMLDAGVHLVWPLVDRVVHKISLEGRRLALEFPNADGAAQLRGKLYWQVLEPERADAVIAGAENLLREEAGRILADESLCRTPLDTRQACLKQALNQRLRSHGLLVTRVELAAAD